MANAAGPSPHTFHIPVMGTGFMIDAPLRVAKYGISSVISLVDDVLIEQMRRYPLRESGRALRGNRRQGRRRPCPPHHGLSEPPGSSWSAGRSRRCKPRRSSPEARSPAISSCCPSRRFGRTTARCWRPPTPAERRRLQDRLRRLAVPGSIDVNIMSKGDRDLYRDGEKLPAKYSDASAALRGFAESTLASSIVFSAGINPRLYSYAAEFDDFFPDEHGVLEEENHSEGKRLPFGRGSRPIPCETRAVGLGVSRRVGLELRRPYLRHQGASCSARSSNSSARRSRNLSSNCTRRASRPWPSAAGRRDELPRDVRITVQGGIGTAEEDLLLREALRRRRHRLGNPVPAGARGHERRRRASSETVRGRRRRGLFERQFALRAAVLESAHVGQRECPPPPHRRGPSRQPLHQGLRQVVQHGVHAAADLHRLAPVPAAEARTARSTKTLRTKQRAAVRESVLAKSCICHDLAGGATLETRHRPRGHARRSAADRTS